MNNSSAHSQSVEGTQSTQRNGRRGTRMTKLKRKYMIGKKLSIDLYPLTGLPSGINRKNFKGHVASLARSFVSILVDNWDDVDSDLKNQIWEAIKVKWDVPDSDFLKKKWISYAGERWRSQVSS
uniref:Uncharacterized protein LOC113786254 n=1 Tax=Cicer arietinum TaxID=3827 RepID=A0A3Q7YA60_CICAR|nr:uncharacterized protein LOC113786254 [Cicer arietinum]